VLAIALDLSVLVDAGPGFFLAQLATNNPFSINISMDFRVTE